MQTPARQKAKDMTAELDGLQREHDDGALIYNNDAEAASSPQSMSTEQMPRSNPVGPQGDYVGPAVLGSSSFPETDINERFSVFFEYFHPHLPGS